MLDGIPPQPKGTPKVEVVLGYDKSGIVRLRAKELGSGRELEARIEHPELLSGEELRKATGRVERLKVS